jgi:hypothetical protein
LNAKFISFDFWKWIFFTCALIPLFATPRLSPDVYRFIWDGDIMHQGINPFSYTPNDLIQTDFFQWTDRLQEVYENGMTDLSKKNFSVYPSLNQFFFFLSSYFSKDIDSYFLIMRMLILITQMMGFVFMVKILDLLSIKRTKVLWVALNPLLIIECMGNFHFEGVMLSFLLVALYFLLKEKLITSAFFWALAVNVKLTPLLLLPMIYKYLKLKKYIVFCLSAISITIALLLIIIWPSLFSHFIQSVQLYFNNFEFNSSIFRIFSLLFFNESIEKAIPVLGPILSFTSTIIIVALALFKTKSTKKSMLRYMLFAYVVYLLFATTVHPWYIIIPLVFGLFTNYRFPVLWSFLAILSYAFYDPLIGHDFIMLGANILMILWLITEVFLKQKGKALNYR